MVDNENRNFNDSSYSLLKRKKKSPIIRFFNKYFGKTTEDIIFHTINYLIFLVLTFICVYPFLYVVIDACHAQNMHGK